jgi:hypothetical protein
MWRHSTEINKNAGNDTSWNSAVTCKVTSTQLRRDPIKVKVLDSGKVIGEGNVTALPLFVKAGTVTKLKCELSNNGEPAGSVILTARFKADDDPDAIEQKKSNALSGDMAAHENDKEKDQVKAVRTISNLIIASLKFTILYYF